jgi:predicted alpha/beta superfamily hydrolase
MRSLVALIALAGCSPPPPSATGGTLDGGTLADAATLPDLGPAPTVIRVHYPAGSHALALRGSAQPLDWSAGVPLVAGADDTWTWSSTTLQAPLEWKPLLDDATWSRGPNYHVEPGQTVDAWPHFTTVQGQVVKLIASFHSTHLPDDRAIWAYLPPSYDENTRATFPVLYMHDAQNLFDPATSFTGVEWGVDETLDAAAEDGSIRETIVIGLENTAARMYEYTPTRDATVGDGGGADLYLALIADELKPVVDGMLRTRPERGETGIMGSSLGGLVSAYAGLKRPEIFGRVGAMSPSTWWDSLVIIGDVTASKGAAQRSAPLYVDSGDSGTGNDDVTDTDTLATTYLSVGYVEGTTFHHVVQPGGQHSETYWAQRLPGALQFLLGARTP